MKEIISKEELKNIIKETVNEVADTVCYTYGPNGKTVILSDFEGKGVVTKDGVSVCNSINFENPYKNIIANIIKQVAQKTVEEADDGTTTSICLTQAFINRGYELLDEGIPYTEIKTALEELSKYVVNELKKSSRKVKKKDIINIAKTASNNDMEVAKMIEKAYKHSNVVKVEESTLLEDKLTTSNGMTLKTTYFDPAFITDITSQSIKYDECYIALIEDTMYTVDPIASLVSKIGKTPLIIIANHFSDHIVRILKQNYNKGSLNVALVAAPGVNNHRSNIIDDISLYTNANLMDNSKKYTELSYLGKVSGVEIKKDQMIIFNDSPNKLVDIRVEDLKKLISTDLSSYDKELTQQRIDSLSGSASVIKVGGESPVEIKEKFDRYEDAIGSVKHALDEGYVEGGGEALVKIFISMHDNIFNHCLLAPYKALNDNVVIDVDGNLTTMVDIDRNMYKEGIIDPTKVTRCALENAISVAKTILSTEAIVLNKHLWKRD